MNKFLWAFPVFLGSGKPLGDGIYWPTNAALDERSRTSSPPRNQRTSQSVNDYSASAAGRLGNSNGANTN